MKHLLDQTNIKNKYMEIVNSKITNQIFAIIFFILLIIHCVENTSVIYSNAMWVKGMYLFRNVLYLILGLGVVGFSLYKKKEAIVATALLTVGMLSVLGSRDFGLMEFFVIMLAMKGQNHKKNLSVFFLVKCLALLLTPLLWKIGILETMYYKDDIVGYYNTFGFCHRNVLGANVAVVCIVWFYIRYRVIKVYDVIAWTVIAIFTYMAADSLTSVLIMLITISVSIMFRIKQEKIVHWTYIKWIFIGCFILFFLISIIGTLFYSKDSTIWKMIDNIFTKRFYFSNYCFEKYGLSLFGQNIDFVSSIQAQNSESAKLILDNSYMRAILYYGLIPGLTFLGIYFWAINTVLERKKYAFLLALMFFSLYGMSERYMLDVYYQFPLLIIWNKYFFKDEEFSKEGKTLIQYLIQEIKYRYIQRKRL